LQEHPDNHDSRDVIAAMIVFCRIHFARAIRELIRKGLTFDGFWDRAMEILVVKDQQVYMEILDCMISEWLFPFLIYYECITNTLIRR
jgi:hypothetical protein